MSRNIISFSLWGDSPKYCVGAIKNAELASTIYPRWVCRYYVGKSTPSEYINELILFKNTEVFIMNSHGNWTSMFWRFLAVDDSSTDIIIMRDTDSRLNEREREAVDEWLSSDKMFHIMRDHPCHKLPMLGGMWGVKKPVPFNFYKKINEYSLKDSYNIDQEFLAKNIYPFAKNNAWVHDEFFEKTNFPSKRKNFEFVGQVFTENGETVQEHIDILRNYLD